MVSFYGNDKRCTYVYALGNRNRVGISSGTRVPGHCSSTDFEHDATIDHKLGTVI